MGEVGLGHISGLRRLAENDVTLRAVQRPPLPHPPLEGATDTIIKERHGMLTSKVTQQGDRLQCAVILQQRKKFILPIAFQRVGQRAPMNYLAL